MEIDNNWTSFFFKAVSQMSGRGYQCLHCGHIFGCKDAKELSDKAIKHLKGKCKK